MVGRVVVFLSHGDAASLRLAGSCALAAVSMGDRVDVFLFADAVRTVIEGADDPESAAALLWKARGAGSCRLLACSASVVAERVGASAADAVLDAIVGWPTVLEWSRGIADRFFF